MYDFAGKRRWFFLLSAALIIAAIVFFALGGLKLSMEFEGGSTLTVRIDKDVSQDDVSSALANLGYGEATVQTLGDQSFFIRLPEITNDQKLAVEEGLVSELELEEGQLTEEGFGSVTAMIAKETIRNAAIAVGVAAAVILLYVTFAFRRMPSPFRYGTCAIIALLHDVCITVGIFAIFGKTFNWEVSPMFVVAMLAVIGYSVNDTIVVFDRIRENLEQGKYPDFRTTVNASLTGTLTRSLNTSITTLLVVVALYLFVGPEIRNFVVALLIGVIAGTYSSIFIASQVLLAWEEGRWRRLVPPLPVMRRLRTSTA
jgi:preprotein translocase subunit SecF